MQSAAKGAGHFPARLPGWGKTGWADKFEMQALPAGVGMAHCQRGAPDEYAIPSAWRVMME